MAGIEAAHVAAHGGDADLLGDFHQRFGILDAIGDRDFDQHMLAGAHHLLALAEVHLVGVVRITASARLMLSDNSPV